MRQKFLTFLKSRLFRFLVVGFINTLVHNGLYYVLMNFNSWASTTNNLVTFVFSVQVAYIGHRFITFANPSELKTRNSFLKFVITALTNIGLSSLFSLIVVDYLNYSYYYLIIFNVSVLPFVSYTVMRLWVFKTKGENGVQAQ